MAFMTTAREVELREGLRGSFEGLESSKARAEAAGEFCREQGLRTWEGEGLYVNGYNNGYEDGFKAAMSAAYRVLRDRRYTKGGE